MGRPRPGGGKVQATSTISEAVPVGNAYEFWAAPDGDVRIVVNSIPTPFVLNFSNSTALAAGHVYGPFTLHAGLDTYIHLQAYSTDVVTVITLA